MFFSLIFPSIPVVEAPKGKLVAENSFLTMTWFFWWWWPIVRTGPTGWVEVGSTVAHGGKGEREGKIEKKRKKRKENRKKRSPAASLARPVGCGGGIFNIYLYFCFVECV